MMFSPVSLCTQILVSLWTEFHSADGVILCVNGQITSSVYILGSIWEMDDSKLHNNGFCKALNVFLWLQFWAVTVIHKYFNVFKFLKCLNLHLILSCIVRPLLHFTMAVYDDVLLKMKNKYEIWVHVNKCWAS